MYIPRESPCAAHNTSSYKTKYPCTVETICKTVLLCSVFFYYYHHYYIIHRARRRVIIITELNRRLNEQKKNYKLQYNGLLTTPIFINFMTMTALLFFPFHQQTNVGSTLKVVWYVDNLFQIKLTRKSTFPLKTRLRFPQNIFPVHMFLY